MREGIPKVHAENLARVMKAARACTDNGLRQYARFLKINVATYCRIEQGKGCDLTTLIKIHDATGIGYDLLIVGGDETDLLCKRDDGHDWYKDGEKFRCYHCPVVRGP